VTLRARITWIRWGVWLGLVALALALGRWAGGPANAAVVVVALVTWWAWGRIGAFVARGSFVRFAALVEAERFDAARVVLGELREVYGASHDVMEQLRLSESSILSLEGRHAEAASLLESIDRRRLDAAWHPWLLNNLAWSLAQTGNGARAVALARESIESAAPDERRVVTIEDLRAYQLGTLGASLVVAGEASEAVPVLEQALARGGRPRDQAARAFYLGEAMRALGRHDEAVDAWRRAAEAAPASEYGKRAETRSRELRPYRSS
jgi:tetratricopeptide (TPR) repeat protein